MREKKPIFGRSEWFKMTNGGLGVHPVTTEGWLLMVIWVLAILLPTAMLLFADKSIESVIWASLSSLALVRESRGLVHQKRRENIFVIGEDTDVTKATTDKYDLELRQ